jgi:GT2 family glycosyltransferase
VRPQLAIVIPTRNRVDTLQRTLSLLATSAAEPAVELIVVDDGSSDGSADAVEGMEFPEGWRVGVIRASAKGPAAARNAGVDAASAPIVLFLGDDSMPAEGLVDHHVRFHLSEPGPKAALLGLVEPCPPLNRSRLQVWLHGHGAQFGYASLVSRSEVSPACFWTSNVSLKRELLLAAGGFDESFRDATCEDTELGLRLGRHGMRLTYDAAPRVWHFHPTNLTLTLERMRRMGAAFRKLTELAPEMPAPRRPDTRHRLKALGLETACRVSPPRAAAGMTWRFLCDQTVREAFWNEAPTESVGPRVGGTLARLALARPEANPPLQVEPQPPVAARPAV